MRVALSAIEAGWYHAGMMPSSLTRGEGFLLSKSMKQKNLTDALRRLLVGIAVLYGAALTILSGLWAAGVTQIWWLALSNIFALGLFAPLALILPAALAWRSYWLRGAALVSLVVFLVQFGAQIFPPVVQPEEGVRLRVATFNHLYRNIKVDQIIAAIRSQQADVVALQELTDHVAEAAQKELIAEYPYQFLAADRRNDYGLGILSKYPFRETTREPDFTGQRVVLDVDGKVITLVNVHLPAPKFTVRHFNLFGPRPMITSYYTAQRSREEPGLVRAIDSITGPLIILGDFNTSDREPFYKVLDQRLHDAYRETAWGFGYSFPNKVGPNQLPIPIPVVRIDYVWSRDGVLPASAWVDCESAGSDHCIVGAELRVE